MDHRQQPSFDYVIVGGGTAGCVLASRLSKALSHLSFLVIEAGPAQDDRVLPAFGYIPGNPDSNIEWGTTTIPQQRLDGAVIGVTHGKILGGSSAINYTNWTRGPSIDFDQWAELVEDDRWSWKGLLPYFRKSEKFVPAVRNGRSESVDLDIHGVEGPIMIEQVTGSELGAKRAYPLREKSARFFESLGLKHVDDHSSGESIGYSAFTSNGFDGKRHYAALDYTFGSNVTFWTETLANKLIMDGSDVNGVLCTDEKTRRERSVFATKEVLVCAGAFMSPKLLMLSGIGPTEELQKHKIDQVVDLPVGRNLSDHFTLPSFWTLADRHLAFGDVDPLVTTDCDWLAGVPNGWIAYKTAESSVLDQAKSSLEPAALQRYLAPGKSHIEHFLSYAFFPVRPFQPPTDCSIISAYTILLSPVSRGTVTLRSSNPHDGPFVDPQFFSSKFDREALFASTRLYLETLHASEELGAKEFGIDENLQGDYTDAALYKRACKNGGTVFHPSGTCAMGSVVDPECCVLGVPNLRVVDASVIPMGLSTNYQAPVYAIAEQVADMILQSEGAR